MLSSNALVLLTNFLKRIKNAHRVECTTDSVAYKFGDRGGGLIDFQFAEEERPDTKQDVIAFGFNTRQTDAVMLRITGATSNDFLEIELVSELLQT